MLGELPPQTPIPGILCPQLSCTSGVFVEMSQTRKDADAATVTLCMDNACLRQRIGGDLMMIVRKHASGPDNVRIRLVVRDARGAVLRRMERHAVLKFNQPNGPDCPPTCWSRAFTYDAHAGLLRAVN